MMDTATLPDRDQAITREDIEREIRLLENNASDCHVRTETVAMLRDIWAHVEELEKTRIRMLNEKLSGEWHDDVFLEGRLQGLNEVDAAVAKIMQKYAAEKGCTKTPGGRTAIFYKRKIRAAIKALKGETTND